MNAVTKNLIINATKAFGTNVDAIMMFIEEGLTQVEYREAEAFLNWSFLNKKYFGYDNFEDRLVQFKKCKKD
jgi:hypothetical protein